MQNIWFTSDNHFSHKGISSFCPDTRPDTDPYLMDEAMIAMWQSQVAPTDLVYMLGDVFFCNAARALYLLDLLPGHKHLIYGNHDSTIRNNARVRSKFDSVNEYKEVKIDGVKVIMFHYPVYEWNGCHRGAYALFGHVHGSKNKDPFISKYRTMDVGIDSRPYDSNQEKPLYSLWSWREVHTILKDREILGHH